MFEAQDQLKTTTMLQTYLISMCWLLQQGAVLNTEFGHAGLLAYYLEDYTQCMLFPTGSVCFNMQSYIILCVLL